jgi:hypothetical protein
MAHVAARHVDKYDLPLNNENLDCFDNKNLAKRLNGIPYFDFPCPFEHKIPPLRL